MNEHALGRGRAPGAENADGESPDTGSRAVFPVLRVDLADDPRVPLDAKTDVAEVFSTPEAAWRRARELNELHAGNGVKFLWKAATLREKPPAGDLDR